MTKHRHCLSDALFEKLLLLKANGLGGIQSTTQLLKLSTDS